MSSKVILPTEIKAIKVMDKHHKAILATGKLLILHMDRTMAATPVMDKANQVIHNPTVVMRIKSRAPMANNRTIITRDSKTRNHQEAKVEERLHMTSQTMVNKIRMTSSQAIIHKVHMMSSQIMISSMIPIIKISPTIHKEKITATTHKMTVVM